MKPTIFIDFDGTLLDVQNHCYHVHNELVQKYSLPSVSFQIYWERKRQHRAPWDNLPKKFSQYFQDYINRIEDSDVLSLDTLIPEGVSLLKQLQQSYSLVLVTKRKNRENLSRQLNSLALPHIFDSILTPLERKKSEIIREYSFSARDIVIGDTEEDILTAKELGLSSIAVSWGLRDKNYLLQFHPTVCIDSPRELLNAVHYTE